MEIVPFDKHSSTSTQLREGDVPTIPAFHFNRAELDVVAEKYAKLYTEAKPFPHLVIDNLFPNWVIDRLVSEIPDLNRNIDFYTSFNQSRNAKSSTEKENQLAPFTRHIFSQLNSSDFIRFLEKITGINGLLPDPHLFGGGVHQTKRGGFLKVHIDNNWDTKLLAYRRLNLILFLNKDWKPDYGGELELWNAEMTSKEASILPVANRIVIFYNSEISNHGHPEPLTCPEGMTRKSLAMYYYTATRPKYEVTSLPHTTVYKARPGEVFKKRRAGIRVLQRFVPPVFSDLMSYFQRRNELTESDHQKKQ